MWLRIKEGLDLNKYGYSAGAKHHGCYGCSREAEEPEDSTPSLLERTDFLEKMSTILLEVAEGVSKFGEPQSPSGSSDSSMTRPPYDKGVLGLIPKEGIRVLREGSAKSRSP
ncbi:uncharacterized protein TNCV_4354101, partial [Trichonephila clavipes]